jgi:hypothetical protein
MFMNDELEAHCRILFRRLREGRVIPFLGAGANLCGRPTGIDWRRDHYLPSGSELASYLAESYAYPAREPQDLIRVSQYIQAVTGGTVLYDELRELFTGDYEPNALHTLLASVPRVVRRWRDEGHLSPYQLIVTTNYDDALERAFARAGEGFDLVTYVARGPDRGKFVHHEPGGASRLIDEPNRYRGLSLSTRTTILKMHGAVDRVDASHDSYVITEDNYIEYLAQKDVSNLLPATLMATMSESHFLFLGYSLNDWNLRVILQRIWGDVPFEEKFTSWAIQRNPSRLEDRLWRRRNVEILNIDLASYVDALMRLCIEPGAEESPR